MAAWRDVWHVGGVGIPIPPDRNRERESTEPGRWERSFVCDVALDEAIGIWDPWAAENGLRKVSESGPHDLGMTRAFDSEDMNVSINVCRMPGAPAQVSIHVERTSALPRTRIASNRLAAHGLSVPVPDGAEPDAHDDLSWAGGEDCHDLRVPGFTVQRMLRSPVARGAPWTARACAPTMTKSTFSALRHATMSTKSSGASATSLISAGARDRASRNVRSVAARGPRASIEHV